MTCVRFENGPMDGQIRMVEDMKLDFYVQTYTRPRVGDSQRRYAFLEPKDTHRYILGESNGELVYYWVDAK